MDFDISPIWKGQHTFLTPVIFSPKQVFNGANLKFTNQDIGSIPVLDKNGWKPLSTGKAGQVLVVVNGAPVWGTIDASIINGVLSVENGGTGLKNYDSGTLIYAKSSNTFEKLLPGNENQILTIQNKVPTWNDFVGVKGNGKSSFLTVWSSEKDLSATNIQIDNNKLILKDKNSSIYIGEVSLIENDDIFSIRIGDNSILLTKESFEIQQGDESLVKFLKGKLMTGVIPVENIDGTLSAQNGGTGINQYNPGDLLYASDEKTLSVLSLENTEGLYLKSVKGRPQWSTLPNDKTTNNTTTSLIKGTSHKAPLQFQPGLLTDTPQPGSIEWDGTHLFVTNDKGRRESLVVHGEDISACSKGVKEVVPLSLGGTGRDLSNSTIGSLFFVDSNTSVRSLKPEIGKFLTIDTITNLPSWHHAVVDLYAGIGINIDSDNKYEPKISINQTDSFTPIWEGIHTFNSGICLGEETTLTIPKNKNGLSQIRFETCAEPNQKNNGDMWFNNDLFVYVNGSTINITAEKKESISNLQYLKIVDGITPVANTKYKIKFPLPYGSDGFTQIKWKFVRLDLRAEEAPTINNTELALLINEEPALEQNITIEIGKQSSYTKQFITPYAYSGDLISIEFKETGNCNYLSLYLTITSESL